MVRRRRHSVRESRDVKDRLIQTRVPERLESVLKEEAQKRRLSVSHLIRNMLEDTLNLVDTVVAGAGDFMDGSAGLAEQVKRDAEKIASTAREAVRTVSSAVGMEPGAATAATATTPATPATGPDSAAKVAAASDPIVAQRAARLAALDHVLAWNQVVVNRGARCASCESELPRGSTAHLGMSQDPTAPPAWLCSDCLATL